MPLGSWIGWPAAIPQRSGASSAECTAPAGVGQIGPGSTDAFHGPRRSPWTSPPSCAVPRDRRVLPLPPGSFDAVFIGFTLELSDTPEIPVVLGECWRTLRPGGHVSVVSLTKAGGRSWMRDLYELGHRRLPSLLDCRPILVRQSLERAGFALREGCVCSLAGLPVEIALARKPA